MADDAKSGTGDKLVDAVTSILGAFTKDSLGALRPVHAIEGVPFAEVVLAYKQVKRAGESIANAVKAKVAKDAHVLFDPDEKLSDLSAYRGCVTALDILTPLIDKDVAEAKILLAANTAQTARKGFAAAAALAPIAPAISAALAIGAFFKTDVSEKYADIKIEDGALTGWVAKTLREQGFKVLSPDGLTTNYSEWREPPVGAAQREPASDRLRAKLGALTKSVSELYEASGEIQQRLTQANKLDAKPAPEDEKLNGMAARLNHSIESVKAFDDAFKGVAQSVFRGDLLHALLKGGGYVLSARILAAAGTVRTEAAGLNSSTSYRAGVIVSYTLLGKDGAVGHNLDAFDSGTEDEE